MAAERIERYELKELLGQGGFGRVHLAFDRDLGREVAIKLVRPELADEDGIRAWFHREARAIASLNHPGAVRIFDYSGPDAAQLFLAMERLHGHTLADVLAQRGPLPPLALCAAAIQLGEVLKHAHGRGIVHRDLKPDNIFIEPDGRLVVTDFGLARALPSFDLGQSLASRGTQLVGTAHYMAPEVIADPAAAAAQSDIYAVGVVLFELATGKLAFAADSAFAMVSKIMGGKHAALESLRKDYPAPLAAAIDRTFSFAAQDRPQSGGALSELFAELGHGIGPDPSSALVRFLHAPDDAFTRIAKVRIKTTEDAVPSPRSVTTEKVLAPIQEMEASARDELTQLATLPVKSPKPTRWALLVAGLAIAAGCAIYWLRQEQVVSSEVASAVVVVSPRPSEPVAAPPVTPPIAALPAVAAPTVLPVTPPNSAIGQTPTAHAAMHPRSPPPHAAERAPVIESPGSLEVNTGKSWAEIYVDKKKLGDTPLHPTISLPPGHYTVRIVNPELGAVERKVTISAGKNTPLSVEFPPR